MTITEVLQGNINKLGNLHVPAKEVELFKSINEVIHDLAVCVEAMNRAAQEQQQEEQNQQPKQDEEVPQDDTDTQ